MQEELTTNMHFDFLQGEVSKKDLYIASIYGAIKRGVPKEKACQQHGISVVDYDSNIDRVLSDPSW